MAGVVADKDDSAAFDAALDGLRTVDVPAPEADTATQAALDALRAVEVADTPVAAQEDYADILADVVDAAKEADTSVIATVADIEFDGAETDLNDLLDATDAVEADEQEDDTNLGDLFDVDDNDVSDDASDDATLDGEGDVETAVDLDDLLDTMDNAEAEKQEEEEDLNNLFDADDVALGEDEYEDPAPILDPFGTISAERPDDGAEGTGKFRIAILGDFSGRAARGDMAIGDDLANRKPIKFDIDNLDDIIRRFATTLVLPIGNDGAGVEVKLGELDDLHPDALYENVEIFAELAALRQRIAMGDGAKSIADMQDWADIFGDLKLASHARAKGSAVPADRKLSAFQSLIGDMQGQLTTASPAADLIGRIVGPYVQAAPNPAQDSMRAAIDEALSGAMRAILHNPDFQAIEATWRSLELLARRIDTGAGLDITLYDVSAEEWAADLSVQDDLAESGLFQMLGEAPRLDAAQGPISAVFGLYTLEETPPHAELLARMSKISGWMNAPFISAISPKFLETAKQDRHPLISKTWDALRALPEAKYIGLAAPRFLLRLPYGKKTEPVDPFDFEEFSLRSGLQGMLWANPVVLSAILMAKTVAQQGKDMRLGDVMSLDDMPFHYMTDQYGDQVALPCTERLLNTRTATEVVARGFIPVLSMKGQNVVRQGSFQALGAGELAGPWGQGAAAEEAPATAAKPDESDAATDDDDLFADGDLDDSGDFDSDTDDDDGGLDALLAGFDDDDDSTDDDDDEMDPELAAMLEGL
ncbi:type VI secretion system contractile sheath large subunit [Yoonia sp. 1_MG-2023]|uniref:type VI secretion system contractile sheath domain-containing protein n=1 Tax=Yoonia sp. 1_MG-2023 TaxID=3062659 RepID=UPI0034C6B4A5